MNKNYKPRIQDKKRGKTFTKKPERKTITNWECMAYLIPYLHRILKYRFIENTLPINN